MAEFTAASGLGWDITIGYFNNGFIGRSRTRCCALGSLSLQDNHSAEQIKAALEYIKKESEGNINPAGRDGGERAIFVTTLPHKESRLEETLKEVGFEKIYSFHRRVCYSDDTMINLWIISW